MLDERQTAKSSTIIFYFYATTNATDQYFLLKELCTHLSRPTPCLGPESSSAVAAKIFRTDAKFVDEFGLARIGFPRALSQNLNAPNRLRQALRQVNLCTVSKEQRSWVCIFRSEQQSFLLCSVLSTCTLRSGKATRTFVQSLISPSTRYRSRSSPRSEQPSQGSQKRQCLPQALGEAVPLPGSYVQPCPERRPT